MLLRQAAPLAENPRPLESAELPDPVPQPHEVLVRVHVCGVCHTELDEIEGRLPFRAPVVPGHQVVGHVIQLGSESTGLNVGDRVGVGWIFSSSGEPDENLSPEFRATGCDANGGYAELMTVPANYACRIPASLTDLQAAPLLCAGAIGYRALKLTQLENGEPLGLMGFGGSGHLVLPMAKHKFPDSPVYVFARDEQTQQFARSLGADWAGGTHAVPPQPVRSTIDTTPVWTPVVAALKQLRPGGRLVINAIRKEDDDKSALLDLSYHDDLWMEREIKSVANITAADIREFLELAAAIPLQPTVETYPLAEANQALHDLKFRPVRGAKVLVVDPVAANIGNH